MMQTNHSGPIVKRAEPVRAVTMRARRRSLKTRIRASLNLLRVGAAALLVAVAFVLTAVPAQAQAIWWATLTVDQSGVYFGCDNTDSQQDNCSTNLTDDDFVYKGVTHRIVQFYLRGTTLLVQFNTLPAGGEWELWVDDVLLLSTEASVEVSGKAWEWTGFGVPWADGQKVRVSLEPPHSHGPRPGTPALTLVTSGEHRPTATTLSFTIPCVSPGRAPVTDYVLEVENTSDNSVLRHYHTVPSPCRTDTVTVPGLTAATTYRVRAFARNLFARTSRLSGWVQGTTLALSVRGGGNTNDPPTDTLTAEFEDVPDEHGGKAFTFRVRLSETVGNFSKSPRASSFDVTRGRVRNVKQVDAGLWQVRVKPSSWRAVGVTLAGGRGCDEAGAVCTPDGRPLSNTVSATVRGLPGLKVAGGRAKEGKPIDFAVTLGRVSSGTVTVDYATEDETATAGSDYTAAAGTLTFEPGETEKVVRVETLADTASEGREVFRLRLSNASWARIVDGKAAGQINNVAASQTAGDRAPEKGVDSEEARALANAGELSPEDAASALLGGSGLEEKRLEALDRLGNANGRYDVGDLLAWIERCRTGGARCGQPPRTPLGAAALPGAAGALGLGVARRPARPRRRGSGRVKSRPKRRRTGMLAVLLAAVLWSCDGGIGPTAAVTPEPGLLTVEWTAPAGASAAAGALVEIDGPGIGEVQAPGLDLYAAEEGNGPRRFVLAGGMRTGPVLEFQVPDRNLTALYSVRVVEVAGEDHRLLEPDDYRAAITPH